MADGASGATSRPFRVLVVCTANMCRSPSAQLLLDDGLRRVGLAQAAQLADGVADAVASGVLPVGAPPLPPADDVPARLRWLVAELDAARGSAGSSDEHDLPDPHVVGTDQHPVVFARIAAAVDALTRAAAATVTGPAPPG